MNIPKPVTHHLSLTRELRELDNAAWMRGYNPLRNLTVSSAQMIYDMARRGCDVRLQCIYDNIESVDPTLMICAERRACALNGLDWMIRQKSAARSRAFDEALAAEQVAYLEAAYGEADDTNLGAAIERLATAFFRGHAHVAPVYSDEGKSLRGFELFDAWNFCRDPALGTWHWNPSASETADVRTLPEVPRGEVCNILRTRHIDYPAMAIYLRNALGERAWGQFLERYGIPPVIITMPQDIDHSRVMEYMDAAAKVAEGGNGALPYGSTVNYATEARGTDPFSEYLRHQQELIVLMATGGTLTSLTGATGIGQGATDAHEETWRTIVRSDAAVIADELNRTVTDALLDRAFPGRPHLAQFAFETEPPMSPAEVFDLASKAVAAGYRITREELEKRTGMALEPVPAAPAADPFEGGLTLNRAEPVLPGSTEPAKDTAPRADLEALADALRADLSPAADAVMEFLENPTPEAASTLAERLPLLLPDDPETAAVIEQVMAEALADTLSASTPVKNTASECHAKDPDNCPYHGTNQVGKSGDWKTLGLKPGRDIKGDPPAEAIFAEEARELIRKGDTVKNPLGDTLKIDERTYKHINKKGRSQKDVETRLREYPQMKACISTPHEIWEDEATGRRKYVQFLEVNGRKVINAVDEDQDHILSWHSNTTRLDYYRTGKLLYVRKEV